MNNSSCAILVPVARHIEPECEQALRLLQSRGYHVQIMHGGSQVDLVRSALATWALDRKFEETMWIDSDVVFDPNDVEKLRNHDLPFTCGLYTKKGVPGFAAKFRNAGVVRFGKGGGLLEMQYVGFGFTHVRRPVYEDILKATMLPRCVGNYDPNVTIIPFFIPMLHWSGGHSNYLSEDCSFCERARTAGHPVKADTSIRLGHVGRYVWTWDDFHERKTYDAPDITVQNPHVD